MITQFKELLRALNNAGVQYVVIGGVAAVMHGTARVTYDLDIVYERQPENLERIVRALKPYQPYLRGAISSLPFLWDAETLRRGLNFTLRTTLGDIDLLGEVAGGGTYDLLAPSSVPASADGDEVRLVSLDSLIKLKRAAGRPKDLEAIAELELLRDEKANGPQ